jgi:adenine-specific DNA-methyltransferase
MLPKTRYQGSKLKIAPWIYSQLETTLPEYQFKSILDLFGGTGTMSLLFQNNGKKVVYNDVMQFNKYVAHSLLNTPADISDKDIDDLFIKRDDIDYKTIVADIFDGVFYTKDENELVDIAAQNIQQIPSLDKKSALIYLLIQACLIKRPYNLFHRNNLQMRMRDVERTFGNKKSWETSFQVHMKRFLVELKKTWVSKPSDCHPAIVLNKSVNDLDSFADIVQQDIDTVYIDPPYCKRNSSNRDYIDYYHFLEGLVDYNAWLGKIDLSRPQKCFKPECETPYVLRNPIEMFEKCISHFRNKNIAISYRKDGFPTIDYIVSELGKYKTNIMIHEKQYQYALSPKATHEVLIIAFGNR